MITSFGQMLLDKAEEQARKDINKALYGYTKPGTMAAMERADDALKKIQKEYENTVEFIMLNYNEES